MYPRPDASQWVEFFFGEVLSAAFHSLLAVCNVARRKAVLINGGPKEESHSFISLFWAARDPNLTRGATFCMNILIFLLLRSLVCTAGIVTLGKTSKKGGQLAVKTLKINKTNRFQSIPS